VCARAPSLPSVLAGIYSSSLYGSSSVEDWDDRSRRCDLPVKARTIPSFRIALAMEEEFTEWKKASIDKAIDVLRKQKRIPDPNNYNNKQQKKKAVSSITTVVSVYILLQLYNELKDIAGFSKSHNDAIRRLLDHYYKTRQTTKNNSNSFMGLADRIDFTMYDAVMQKKKHKTQRRKKYIVIAVPRELFYVVYSMVCALPHM
jgi:predicted nucleic acid-binding protein